MSSIKDKRKNANMILSPFAPFTLNWTSILPASMLICEARKPAHHVSVG